MSILALDIQKVIELNLTHVLYGASKDFCANGLRLGLVCTNNEGLIGALSSIRYVLKSVQLSRVYS